MLLHLVKIHGRNEYVYNRLPPFLIVLSIMLFPYYGDCRYYFWRGVTFYEGGIIMNKKCEKKGHKFRARYDEKPNEQLIGILKSFKSGIDGRSLLYYKVYVYDICVRCGKIIKRE